MNLNQIKKKIRKKVNIIVEVSEHLGAVKLEGHADNWNQVVRAGYIAAASDCRGVINNISIDEIDDSISKPEENENCFEF